MIKDGDITICVVIPAYNAARFICEALDSVAGQKRKPDEVIVINDGSTDNTLELIEKWTEKNKLIVRVITKDNAGLPAARNTGITSTNHQWIALLDADDVWRAEHLESLEAAITKVPDSVVAFCDNYIFTDKGIVAEWLSKAKSTKYGLLLDNTELYQLDNNLYSSLVPGNYIAPSSLILSRDAALAIDMFDESLRFIEDRDFLLRLSKYGKFIYTNKLTTGCREHDYNITNKRNMLRNIYFAFRVLNKMLKHSAQLSLDASEQYITKKQLNITASSLIYNASLKGVKAYLEAFYFLVTHHSYGAVLNPKHFLRALYYAGTKNSV